MPAIPIPPPPPGVSYYDWKGTKEEAAILREVPKEHRAALFREMRSLRFRLRLWLTRRRS